TFVQLALKKFRPQVWMAFSIFVLFNALHPLSDKPTKDIIPVRIVQANIGNFLKIQSEHGDTHSYQAIRNKYENLSIDLTHFHPELIIWPETAHPNTFYARENSLDPVFERILEKTKAEILIGGYDHDMSK